MSHAISCRCGSIQGKLDTRHTGRAICYCKDCQAFARFLAKEEGGRNDVLDAEGGTDIVATLPSDVEFTQGKDKLVCMSLSPKGLYRWYSSCCKTPVGNTPRDFKTSYVGLVSACLRSDAKSLDESFGPAKIHINTNTALNEVQSTPSASFFGVLKIMRNVIGARIGGKYRINPFFDTGTGNPVVAPRVLNLKERRSLG